MSAVQYALYTEQLKTCIRDLIAIGGPKHFWWKPTWKKRVFRAKKLLRQFQLSDSLGTSNGGER